MTKPLRSFLVLSLAIVFSQIAYGQVVPSSARIAKLIEGAAEFHNATPTEKLFIQFDKPYYAAGDTLWFKSWQVRSSDHHASASIKLYVDILNDSSRVIHSMVVPVQNGLAQGDITLSPDLESGTYTMRAYTNWMRNFGEQNFCYKRFTVGNVSANTWLVNESHTTKTTSSGKEVTVAIELKDIGNTAVPYKDVALELTSKSKKLLTRGLTTTDNGLLKTSFIIPQNTGESDFTLVLADASAKANPVSFPFYVERDIDLQFLPEGGYMVAGLFNKVGFKATGNDGMGRDITGVVLTSRNDTAAVLNGTHNGMGSFMLLPQAGETYHAKFKEAGGNERTVDLTVVQPSGTALRVDGLSNPDSVLVRVTATADIAAANEPYLLMAQSKDSVHLGLPVELNRGFFNIKISKQVFRTGIVSFVLLNSKNLPVNERRVFIDHKDAINIGLNGNATYLPKDSISLQITATDKEKRPVVGNFTISVTDDSSVAPDKDADNIITSMLLTSEIRGGIDKPQYYFDGGNAERKRALDNLLLTQAWTGYNWAALPPLKPTFEMERNNHISGKALGFLNKPLKSAKVKLFAASKKYGVIIMDTLTNDKGEFDFRDLPLTDTIAYGVKLESAKGKEMAGTIQLNEIEPLKAKLPFSYRPLPWFISNKDTLMNKFFNNGGKPDAGALALRNAKGRVLKEVVIRSKKGSMVLRDDIGEIAVDITEKELIAARKTSLLELLRMRIKGFMPANFYSDDVFKRPGRHIQLQYTIQQIYLADVVIDNQSVQANYGFDVTGDTASYYDYLRTTFNYLAADDVKSIKVISGTRKYIVITTRSGAGVVARSSLGSGSYRPLPMYFPRSFYTPKYTANSVAAGADDRTTIHWEPNLVTGEDGKATVSFYAAPRSSTYTVTISGTDMQGKFGYQTHKITVSDKKGSAKSR